MNRYSVFRDYIRYYFSAKTKHGIHSPFVFEFVTKVLNKRNSDGQTAKIEKLRRELLSSSIEINGTDMGAGRDNTTSTTQKVKDIVKNSAKSRKYAGLLYRIVKYYDVRKALELGTSAGIGSMYMAAAMPQGKVISIEGNREIAKLAAENFAKAGFENIILVTGNFDEVLEGIIEKEKTFDLVFFDGNHREEATLRYFEQCLPSVGNDTVFVFDDIRWSEGMWRAWEKIKLHQRVKVTVDLFFVGIVFFRKEMSKENFVLRF
jgi:predicted O-methyltransferase YrrM